MRQFLVIIIFISALAFGKVVDAQRLPVLIPYRDGNKWGYADSNGKVQLGPKWDEAELFYNGRARVVITKKDEDYVCTIDTNGHYIIPPWRHWNGKTYNKWDAEPYYRPTYNARSKKRNKWGIIDANNREVIACWYDKTIDPKSKYPTSGIFSYDSLLHTYAAVVSKDGKYGIIDTGNRVLLPFKYDGIIWPRMPYECPPLYFKIVMKGKYGIIDTAGREIVPAKYDYISSSWPEKNKWIQLWKGKRKLVADPNGKIIVDIKGYSANFPQDSLIPVLKLTGRYGIMNYDYKEVIPCIYDGVSVMHDSICVLMDSLDMPNNKHTRYRKFYSSKTFKPITDWLTDEQIYGKPKPTAPTQPPLPPVFPNSDSIDWMRTYSISRQRFSYPVKGIGRFSHKPYIAIMDTAGRYILPPRESDATIRYYNLKDSLLVLLKENWDSFQCVTDFNLHQVMKFQRNSIETAFYYNGRFYAVMNTKFGYYEYTGGRATYSYYHEKPPLCIVGADGMMVKEFQQFGIINSCDQYGVAATSDQYYSDAVYIDASEPHFGGYFRVENEMGRMGIIQLGGRETFPAINFKYDILEPCGAGIFKVESHRKRGNREYVLDIVSPKGKIVCKPEPHMIDSNGHILLDSMTVSRVERIVVAQENGGSEQMGMLFKVFLSREPDEDYWNNFLYMDAKGRGYYKNIPVLGK